MSDPRWQQISDLFDAALRLDPAERAGWVRGACGPDDALRAEIEHLLAEDEEAAGAGS